MNRLMGMLVIVKSWLNTIPKCSISSSLYLVSSDSCVCVGVCGCVCECSISSSLYLVSSTTLRAPAPPPTPGKEVKTPPPDLRRWQERPERVVDEVEVEATVGHAVAGFVGGCEAGCLRRQANRSAPTRGAPLAFAQHA